MASQVKTPEAAAKAFEILGQACNGYVVSSALSAVTRLGVADAIGDNRIAVTTLAARLSANSDALLRVLRLLSGLGIFEETGDGEFANNAPSSLLRGDTADSQKDMVLFVTDPFHFKSYTDMLPTIRDGRTAIEHMYGKGCFDVFAEEPGEQERFDNAMTSLSARSVPAILDAYDFSGIGTLVDVAGGHGMLLSSILLKYPSMRGVLFDLAHVVPGAQKRIEQKDLASRCEVVAGDFFQSVPSGDAIIMKHIIHDWDDERALQILKNCRTALDGKKPGKILIAEFLLSGRNEIDPSKFLDIEMLMMPGGRERTEAQFADLLKAAGFGPPNVTRTKGPMCIIEARCV